MTVRVNAKDSIGTLHKIVRKISKCNGFFNGKSGNVELCFTFLFSAVNSNGVLALSSGESRWTKRLSLSTDDDDWKFLTLRPWREMGKARITQAEWLNGDGRCMLDILTDFHRRIGSFNEFTVSFQGSFGDVAVLTVSIRPVWVVSPLKWFEFYVRILSSDATITYHKSIQKMSTCYESRDKFLTTMKRIHSFVNEEITVQPFAAIIVIRNEQIAVHTIYHAK